MTKPLDHDRDYMRLAARQAYHEREEVRRATQAKEDSRNARFALCLFVIFALALAGSLAAATHYL